MSATPGLHRRSFSAVRISIDRMLDDDELAPLNPPTSYSDTPRLGPAVPEKDASASAYGGVESKSRARPPVAAQWRKPQRSPMMGCLRATFVIIASASVAGIVIYVLVASRISYVHRSVANVEAWRKHLESGTAAELRADGTYAYAVPLPNDANAYEEHPIHGLIRDAKAAWQTKLSSQSRSYDEAVREYRRRNRRDPPPGFVEWYRWAKENDVQLIDEFDMISKQIEVYLAIRPSVLRQRLAEQRSGTGMGHNFGIIEARDGRLSVNDTWRPAVSEGFVDLMEPLAHLLPDVDVPLFLHDGPSTSHKFDILEAFRRAAKHGEFVDESTMDWQQDRTRSKWSYQCDGDSPYRQFESGVDAPRLPGPAFIQDHTRAMSYCEAPQNLELHGALVTSSALDLLRPSFTLSTLPWSGGVVWPSTIQYDLNPKNETPFMSKASKLLWRGSPDGVDQIFEHKWRQSHRFRLISLLNSNSTQSRVVRETRLNALGNEYQVDVGRTSAELNARYSNVRPTGVPVQCEPELCDEVTRTLPWASKATLEEMADNRYVMDVDGNAYSARFRAHLASNQVPFKSTIFPEWYEGRIQPWVHYVPVRVDYSDLYNLLAFFDGGVDAARTGHHDELAEEIAYSGADWAAKHWRTQDMQAYVYRLLLEWARVMDPKREV